MRMLLTARMPNEAFNRAVQDGSAGEKLNRILEALKPEAVYFTAQGGQRTALIIVDLPDASKIPSIAEPFFLLFDAGLDLQPVMTPDDLRRANLDSLGKAWK